jgi:hypothetical protein
MARTSKTTLVLPQVLSVLPDKPKGANLLVEYYREKYTRIDATVYPVEPIHTYQYSPQTYDPDAKPGLYHFMKPIYNGAFSPDVCVANERQAVYGRITSIRSDVQPGVFILRCMEEFIQQLIPVPHLKHPYDHDEVNERQPRPSQRRIIDVANGMLRELVNFIASFQKREAYGKLTDPRLISTFPGKTKVEYSRYCYVLNDYIKQFIWYAFGCTPCDIAERVMEVCREAMFVILTDYKRWDGRLSVVFRMLEQMILLRLFHPDHHAEILELHRQQYSQPAVCTLGTRYDQGYARGSGSPETSSFNSIENKFITFLCARHEGYSVYDAFNLPGIYGGDDGISTGVPPAALETAARLVGQMIEARFLDRGQPGVTFLARIFSPSVWYGDCTSICDVQRQLGKFHTCASPCTDPLVKASEKAFAYMLTDTNTPIMGPLCRHILENSGMALTSSDATWWAQYPKDVQFPNGTDTEDWMVDVVLEQLPTFDYQSFHNWLATDDVLSPPLCVEKTSPIVPEVVVCGNTDPLVPAPPPAVLPAPRVPLLKSKVNVVKRSKPRTPKGVTRRANGVRRK